MGAGVKKMKKTGEIIKKNAKYVMNTYGRTPVAFRKAKGIYLWDYEGKKYIDFFSGLAVCSIGYGNKDFLSKVKSQIDDLIHTSNVFYIEPQTRLAEKLCKLSFADKVFFCNSGAEANEGAIKLCRAYAKKRNKKNCYEIITMDNSFHGRTLATLSATGQKKYQKGFEPMVDGFKTVEFNNIGQLRKNVTGKTAGIMIEFIQGEGGVNVASREFAKGVRRLCTEKDIPFVADEVQTGIGRTGKMFAYEHYGIEPDVMTLAKALGGGIPIGAVLAKDRFASAFFPGMHASTFGGNFFATSAGNAVMDVIEKEKIVRNAKDIGLFLKKELEKLKTEFSFIKDIRGQGLMVGMELDIEGKEIVKKCLENGLLINCTADRVLRFIPPLIIKRQDVSEMIGILKKSMR